MELVLWALASLTAFSIAWVLSERWESRSQARRRVLVNLDTGRTFSGVLWSKTGDWLVLRNAEMVERGAAPVPVDGEVIVERDRVEFVQAF
jgi:hypothetical protein